MKVTTLLRHVMENSKSTKSVAGEIKKPHYDNLNTPDNHVGGKKTRTVDGKKGLGDRKDKKPTAQVGSPKSKERRSLEGPNPKKAKKVSEEWNPYEWGTDDVHWPRSTLSRKDFATVQEVINSSDLSREQKKAAFNIVEQAWKNASGRFYAYNTAHNAVAKVANASKHGGKMVEGRKNADGEYQDDGSFRYDYDKIARETGHSVDDVKSRGVSWARNNPKRGGKMKENQATDMVAKFLMKSTSPKWGRFLYDKMQAENPELFQKLTKLFWQVQRDTGGAGLVSDQAAWTALQNNPNALSLAQEFQRWASQYRDQMPQFDDWAQKKAEKLPGAQTDLMDRATDDGDDYDEDEEFYEGMKFDKAPIKDEMGKPTVKNGTPAKAAKVRSAHPDHQEPTANVGKPDLNKDAMQARTVAVKKVQEGLGELEKLLGRKIKVSEEFSKEGAGGKSKRPFRKS